jgi:MFS superfamily sulfate permease-like transporter
LRGFISGVAIVIFVEQLIPELGLEDLAHDTGASHSSTWEKIKFIGGNYRETHLLTFYIALGAFLTLLGSRFVPSGTNNRALKTYATKKFNKNWISLIPDILTVVAVSACTSSCYLT